MTSPPPPPEVPTAAPGPRAEWADRVVASLIDAVFVVALWFVVWLAAAVVGVISDSLATLIRALGNLAGVAYGLYLGFLEGTRGQSPGKAIQGLKVVRISDGGLLGGTLGVVRRIAHVIDAAICGIGFLFPLWDPDKQTIADKLVETVVLRDQERRAFGPELFLP